jgi:2,4-dienoyl-CoA reductase (NADPH2)
VRGRGAGARPRGHRVVLYESAGEIGGQFNLARRIPGKEEFNETLRYFRRQLELLGVELRLGCRVTAGELAAGGYAHVILATGVTPRRIDIPGIDHSSVIYYDELLAGAREAGPRVAIVGAGGIGYDVAEFLSQEGPSASLDPALFADEWGIDSNLSRPGGIKEARIETPKERRRIYLLQRKASRPGRGLGKTTGWIHRASLRSRGVEAIPGVSYEGIDDRGLHIRQDGEDRLLEVDTIVICAGQESLRALAAGLEPEGVGFALVGGADEARELDAKRAIAQASSVAAAL